MVKVTVFPLSVAPFGAIRLEMLIRGVASMVGPATVTMNNWLVAGSETTTWMPSVISTVPVMVVNGRETVPEVGSNRNRPEQARLSAATVLPAVQVVPRRTGSPAGVITMELTTTFSGNA